MKEIKAVLFMKDIFKKAVLRIFPELEGTEYRNRI